MTATFSPAESARLAAFDRAPDAPESYAATVERMARALFCAEVEEVGHIGGTRAWDHITERHQRYYLRLAEAAFRAEHERGDGAA